MNLAIDGDLRVAAESLKQFYDELRRVGFIENEAMQILNMSMQVGKQK